MAFILFAFFALLMVVRPLEVSADACLEEMNRDSSTVVECNFPWNVCNVHSSFELSCSTNGQVEKTPILTCFDGGDSLSCQRLVTDCSYRIIANRLLLGLTESSNKSINCVVHIIDHTEHPCHISNNTVTTPSPPAPASTSSNAVNSRHRLHAGDNSDKQVQDHKSQQISPDLSQDTNNKPSLWTDQFVGVTVALGSMMILLVVVVALWLRDRRGRKMKYSLRYEAAVQTLEGKLKALEAQHQKCATPHPPSTSCLTYEVRENGTASQPLINNNSAS